MNPESDKRDLSSDDHQSGRPSPQESYAERNRGVGPVNYSPLSIANITFQVPQFPDSFKADGVTQDILRRALAVPPEESVPGLHQAYLQYMKDDIRDPGGSVMSRLNLLELPLPGLKAKVIFSLSVGFNPSDPAIIYALAVRALGVCDISRTMPTEDRLRELEGIFHDKSREFNIQSNGIAGRPKGPFYVLIEPGNMVAVSREFFRENNLLISSPYYLGNLGDSERRRIGELRNLKEVSRWSPIGWLASDRLFVAHDERYTLKLSRLPKTWELNTGDAQAEDDKRSHTALRVHTRADSIEIHNHCSAMIGVRFVRPFGKLGSKGPDS